MKSKRVYKKTIFLFITFLTIIFRKKSFFKLFKNEKMRQLAIRSYGKRNAKRLYNCFDSFISKPSDKTIVVYRGYGNLIDTGTINDYVNCKLTGIFNSVNVVFVLNVSANIQNDLCCRIFEQEHVANPLDTLSMQEFCIKYKNVFIGDYLELNKYKYYFFKKIIHFSKETNDYFLREENIIKPQKCFGVFYRGTDYVTLKPKNHPSTPPLRDFMDKIDKIIGDNIIYLATEDKEVVKAFTDRYKDRVKTNHTLYFEYANGEKRWISNIHLNVDDEYYLRSITYLSSMNLLSKCSRLVATYAGGSVYAIILNNRKYLNKENLIKNGFN